MSGEKIHLFLLTYLPLVGFATYSVLTGFDNPLFLPIYLSGWIVLAIYQTILAGVYTAPKNIIISIVALFVPLIFLIANAWFFKQDFSVIFIELAAVDMMGIILGLIYAFAHKAIVSGTKDAPVFAILFTIGIIGTAGFFLSKLFIRFFESQSYDWIVITVILFAVARSVFFFASRLAAITNRMNNSGKEENPGLKKEASVSTILISVGIWILIVPFLVWIVSMLIPHQ
jgi:hypothetical protein